MGGEMEVGGGRGPTEARAVEEISEKIAIEEEAVAEEESLTIEEELGEQGNPLEASYSVAQKELREQAKTQKIVVSREEKLKEAQKIVVPEKEIEQECQRFHRKDAELAPSVLRTLLGEVSKCRDKDEILGVVSRFYHDAVLALEAFDFLIATTLGKLQEMVKEAKATYEEQHARELQASHNIASQVQEFVTLGLGTPSKLRGVYRDILNNPREPTALCLELGDKFSYKEIRQVLAYLFHALGNDLNAKGPSIDPVFLHRLLSEVKNLQASLGVFKLSRDDEKLERFLFKKKNIPLPSNLNSETSSRILLKLLQERYPTPESVLSLIKEILFDEISDPVSKIDAMIIISSCFREDIHKVPNSLVRSIEHRNELYKAIIGALERLEEELDELAEKEYEEEEVDKETEEQREGEPVSNAEQPPSEPSPEGAE
jgi:type III secretion protein W